MSKRGLRKCCVCHTDYSFCLCNVADRDKPTWHFAYCSENCRDIYTVTSGYENGKISANDAKAQLEKLDLSALSNFGESYQNAIIKINASATPVETEADSVANTDNVAINEGSKNVNMYYKKPRNKKVKNDGDVE